MNTAAAGGRGSDSLAREILLLFLRFLAASIVLYTLYYLFAGRYYMRLIAFIASPMLALFRIELVMGQALKITEDIALNPLVFLSLVIAVRHIAWRLKLRAAVTGVVILTVVNAFTVFMAFLSNYRQSDASWELTEFLGLTINFFLPMVLWLVLLPIRQAFPFFTLKRN